LLKLSFRTEIRESLGKGRFHGEEFLIEQKEHQSSVTLSISYRFDSEFFFRAEIPNIMGQRNEVITISILTCPGIMSQKENSMVKESYELLTAINEWTKRVYEELNARPIYRDLAENQEEIEELINRVNELPDEYFTKEEAQEMKHKLDDLEQSFLLKLHEIISDQNDLKKRERELHSEIESLKMTIDLLKKPGWAGTMLIRFSDLFKDSETKKLLRSGAIEVGKQLLVEAGKKQLGA